MTLVQAASELVNRFEMLDINDIRGRLALSELIENLRPALRDEIYRTDTIRNDLLAKIASSALQGILANTTWSSEDLNRAGEPEAKAALRIADSLLNLLEKPI